MPTGKEVLFRGIALYHFEGDHISKFTNIFDMEADFENVDLPPPKLPMGTLVQDIETIVQQLSIQTGLSKKQIIYLSFWIHGYSMRDIGAKIGNVTSRTIEWHVAKSMDYLRCSSRRDLVDWFFETENIAALRALYDKMSGQLEGSR